jgi:primosomal protein N' (replication factor Y)
MVFAALPPAFRKPGRSAAGRKLHWLSPGPGAAGALPGLQARAPAQGRVLDRLLSEGRTDAAMLCAADPAARAALASLRRKGLVLVEEQDWPRTPAGIDLPVPPAVVELTQGQQRALGAVTAALAQDRYAAFLLHGVTGSGKTEVYLRAIERSLAAGRGAILLVPEISLTPQLISRVTSRLGDRVALLHSGLSDGERLDEWRRLRSGRARVAVGARSAIFAPLEPLGVLVVDEEHDSSYKQSDRLPYNGRDLALVRARQERAVVLLGTATPSVESYAHALAGRSTLIELAERVQQRPLPCLEVVDRKRELAGPIEQFHTLGPVLAEALAETLDRREQAILFLNRRGYSSYLLCQACGEGVRCQNCSVALVHHLRENCLRCHYCGLSLPLPEHCPSCGAARMGLLGLGTEKCEEEVRRRFPGARVVRLDSDSVAKRSALHEVLGRFARGEADVLVGTQMVTKGHDIPGVTLVGVVLADLGLQLPDFRAAERCFQQLLQVAGRAGRGERPGRVIVQTLLPEHPAIVLAQNNRFKDFFERELQRRKALGYPPARRLMMVRVSHAQAELAAERARQLAGKLRQVGGSALQVLGPVPSPLARIRGRYRYQVLVKSTGVDALQRAARAAQQDLRSSGGAKILFDMDPIDML